MLISVASTPHTGQRATLSHTCSISTTLVSCPKGDPVGAQQLWEAGITHLVDQGMKAQGYDVICSKSLRQQGPSQICLPRGSRCLVPGSPSCFPS